MEISLPNAFTRKTMYSLLNKVIDNDLNPKAKKIDFDFCDLTFIEPSGITILSNLFEWLNKRGVKAAILYPSSLPGDKNDPIQFLDDSMFFRRYTGSTITDNPQIRSTTIPLKLVAYKDSFQWLGNDFTYWLSSQLGVPPESLVNIKMSFGEIFNNINDHAQENIGCIFAQHYPKKKVVKISISDFGIGIPHNIRKLKPSLQDHEAIKVASEEGFTTKTSPRNLGAGLHTLIENVVNDNDGEVYIHSNYGILNCTKGNDKVRKKSLLKTSFYPGTLIEVVLKTDKIENIIDYEEEFEWF